MCNLRHEIYEHISLKEECSSSFPFEMHYNNISRDLSCVSVFTSSSSSSLVDIVSRTLKALKFQICIGRV